MANSGCQLDQSGQQSITFLGPVIGSSGTTLVFTNSSTLTNSQNWVVLSAPATNNSAIVLAVLKNATNSTQRLNLNINTNLSQIFNGPISDLILTTDSGGIAGGGGVIKQGAGAAYLNAANTYTLGTTNLAGLLAGNHGKFSCKLTGTVCGYQALTGERLVTTHGAGEYRRTYHD